jgi:diaminopimelate decarboxylase
MSKFPIWAIENFLTIQNNHLVIDGVDAVELARQFETPLFVFSE